MASLKVDDATQRTRVVDALSTLCSRLNQAKAKADQRRKSLGSSEAMASSGPVHPLQPVGDPARWACPTRRKKPMRACLGSWFSSKSLKVSSVSLTSSSATFSPKREELLEAFETHKQALLDDRQRKAQSVADAAARASWRDWDAVLSASRNSRRAQLLLRRRCPHPEAACSWSPACASSRTTCSADDIEAKVKAARDQAVRALRDRSELMEAGGNVIKLGPRHRFSVNTQALDPDHHAARQPVGVTSHQHRLPGNHPRCHPGGLPPLLVGDLGIRSPELYRGEYLAGQVLATAMASQKPCP